MEKQATFKLEQPFITLGQLLKEEGIIPTGGAAKWFLKEQAVTVNAQAEDRRGKKLYPGDEVTIVGVMTITITITA